MEDITRLFKHVQDTIGKLTRLSDNRLQRLEKCLQLKQFDEECSKVGNPLPHMLYLEYCIIFYK